MAELKVKLSDKALSLIAQLQKEIFNRRRKKVTPSGVVETLVESAAKSQSDKRFATSWKNLVVDIEKAAKLANQHGSKPSNLSDEEVLGQVLDTVFFPGTYNSRQKSGRKLFAALNLQW